MIKAIFSALTGISEDIDSQEAQEAWDRRRYQDENDLDDDDSDYQDDSDDDEQSKSWWRLW